MPKIAFDGHGMRPPPAMEFPGKTDCAVVHGPLWANLAGGRKDVDAAANGALSPLGLCHSVSPTMRGTFCLRCPGFHWPHSSSNALYLTGFLFTASRFGIRENRPSRAKQSSQHPNSGPSPPEWAKFVGPAIPLLFPLPPPLWPQASFISACFSGGCRPIGHNYCMDARIFTTTFAYSNHAIVKEEPPESQRIHFGFHQQNGSSSNACLFATTFSPRAVHRFLSHLIA